MLLLDVLIRYPAITLLIVTAAFCVRDARSTIQGRLGALTALAMASVLLGTAPDVLKLPEPFFTIIRWSDIANLALLWLFGLSLFRDHFKMGVVEWGGLSAYTVLIGIHRAWDLGYISERSPELTTFTTAFSALFAVHLIWTALAGRRDDLVESRRKGRLWFALGLAIAAIISVTAEGFYYNSNPEEVDLVRAAVTLPMVIWACYWLVDFRSERLLFQPPQFSEPAPSAIDPKDSVTHKRLLALMNGEAFYKEQGLTIRMLSEKLKVPEHQLRVLINQGMGYRNFAAFLNHYRLGYAKQVLADPAQARLPVLTIAMDAGFNSLAPFNRAFKQAEGLTPTAYRKEKLINSGQS